MRAVIDTGVWVSGLIRRQGTTGDVLHALRDERFIAIYTTETMVEIIEVRGRVILESNITLNQVTLRRLST